MRRARILVRAPPAWAAPGLAAVIAAVYLVWQPPSADLAAAVYRVGQFSAHGFVVFDPQWYAGFQPLGYSLLLGPLGAALGVRLLAAVSAVAAALAFARLVEPRPGEPRPGEPGPAAARAASVWFAAGIAVSLGSGRVAFTLGTALGLGALLAARRPGRPAAAAAGALAGASAVASPLSGLFLALAALAGAPAAARRSRRARLLLAAAAAVPAGAMALAFPTPGYEPFAASSFWPALLLLLAVAAAVPALRPAGAFYAAACVAAYVVATPLGGNVVRLGALFAGPLALVAIPRERRPVLVLLVLPLAYWQLQAPIRDVVVADGDLSTGAAYYAPLERFLTAASPLGPRRIEVPFTRNHWEAALLAPSTALARGWERQLDIAVNGLFYRPGLTAPAYRAWLEATGVAYVALPDTRLDASAAAEAALIRAGLPYLRRVAALPHWQVFAVAGARPLASPPATVLALAADRFTLDFARAGTSVVRLRFTRFWRAGGACVERAPGGFTEVRVGRPGPVTVSARLDLGGLVGPGGGGCRGAG